MICQWNRYESGFITYQMAIVFLTLILVITLWNVDPMEEEVLEALMTKLGVGHVIIFGHIAANCHTMRCYSCSGFGHKAQECPSQRSQPRVSPSCTSARKVYESWKKNDTGSFEGQRTNNL